MRRTIVLGAGAKARFKNLGVMGIKCQMDKGFTVVQLVGARSSAALPAIY